MAGNAENHVWCGVGAGDTAPTRESKSTLNGVSTYTIDAYPDSRAVVRICRIGSTFRTFHQPFAGGAFSPHLTYERPDLPATLQVGAFASEQLAPVDERVHVGWITFSRPASVADCSVP
jgi:hypothetical protein